MRTFRKFFKRMKRLLVPTGRMLYRAVYWLILSRVIKPSVGVAAETKRFAC